MVVKKLLESGLEPSLLGLSLSHESPVENMLCVAQRLADKHDSHCKFQRMIITWWDIIAPRYFWQQLDTYRIGVATQSGSTMHNIMKRQLSSDDFTIRTCAQSITLIEEARKEKDFQFIKENLPEGYLQRRIWMTNYQVLKRIIIDRRNHKLADWSVFIERIISQVDNPELLGA